MGEKNYVQLSKFLASTILVLGQWGHLKWSQGCLHLSLHERADIMACFELAIDNTTIYIREHSD